MISYKNLGGNSNVLSYEIGLTYIDVKFGDGLIYRYSNQSAGINNVNQMKILAEKGVGLNSFIMRNCKTKYEFKTR